MTNPTLTSRGEIFPRDFFFTIMTIALDYDGTITRDPKVFCLLYYTFLSADHTVIVVTNRDYSSAVQAEIRNVFHDNNLQIVFAGNRWKKEAAKADGWEVDIWVDDMPETISKQYLLMEDRNEPV